MLVKKLNVVLEIDPKELPSYKAKGFEEYVPDVKENGDMQPSPTLEGKTYDQWTANELKTFANDKEIDIADKNSKGDIWSAIVASAPEYVQEGTE